MVPDIWLGKVPDPLAPDPDFNHRQYKYNFLSKKCKEFLFIKIPSDPVHFEVNLKYLLSVATPFNFMFITDQMVID